MDKEPYWKLVNRMEVDPSYSGTVSTFEREVPGGILILVVARKDQVIVPVLQFVPFGPPTNGPFRGL